MLPPHIPGSAPPPHGPAGRRRAWTRWALLLGCWTLVGLFFGTRPYLRAHANGWIIPGPEKLLVSLGDAYVWAAFTPAILWLAGRWRFSPASWKRSLPVHLVAATAFACASAVLDFGMERAFALERQTRLYEYFGATFHFNVQWYAIVVGLRYALDYYHKFRDRELLASRLETRLAEARLEALKMQIQPHFLFNTLHVISELVHEDPAAADRMIARLGDLLRLTVDETGRQEIPLRQEMDFLRAYLEIQQTRFQDRLSVELAVDPAALEGRVPTFVLQPLVENAIRHGIAPRGGPGRIRISAARVDDVLELEVRDDGAGLAPPGSRGPREGVGLRNTRTRLEQLYGGAQHLELAGGEGGGAVARVRLPFRTAEEPPSSSPLPSPRRPQTGSSLAMEAR